MVISVGRDLLLSAIGLFVVFECVKSIKLVELDVPKYLSLGTRAALSCRWQLGPADVLYSVKWYKDGKEFFRHVPKDVEPRRKFPLPGVDVEDSDPSGSRILLSPTTMESGGRYRCEVSGEKPLFPTVSEHKDTTVIVLPDHGPELSGFKSKYRVGDRVQATCRSGHSQPATQLSWYINGEPLPKGNSIASYRSENGLIITTTTLDFELTEQDFKKNSLNVKCLATISPVYWKSNEESAVQEDIVTDYHDIATMSRTGQDKKADQINSSKKLSADFLDIVLCLYFLRV